MCFGVVACSDDSALSAASAASTTNTAGNQEYPAETLASSTAPDQAPLIDVASVYNGAFTTDPASIMEAARLLIGMKNHGDYLIHAEGQGKDSRSDFIIELAAPARIETLRFIGPLNETLAPKEIEVALSDLPADDFEVIGVAEFTVSENHDPSGNAFDISIPVSAKRTGRFLRFRMSGSLMDEPSQNYHAMASLQALGTFDQAPALPDVNGVYHFQGDFGNDSSGEFYLVLHQDGGWIEGCAVTTPSSSLPIKPDRLLNLVSGRCTAPGSLGCFR